MQNIIDKIGNFFDKTFGFFTDPSSIGFAILIAAGLGVILYLMKSTEKGWRVEEKKSKNEESKKGGKNFPLKPF
jgi:putative Mn2+ efflux pump MntP